MKRNEAPPEKPRRTRWWILLAVVVMAAGAFFGIMAGNGIAPREMWARLRSGGATTLSLELPRSRHPRRMRRPYGMAPLAFGGYIRACTNAGIHPFRIGQTIGDHPRSVGYHKRDGGAIVDFFAVDI